MKLIPLILMLTFFVNGINAQEEIDICDCRCKETYSPTVSPTLSPTSPELCYKPIDMVLILDKSGSIKNGHYSKAKTFVSNFVDNFDKNNTKVGLIEFSTGSRKILDLTNDENEIEKGIDRLSKRTGGWTRTHLAFKMYNNKFISQLRPDTKKIIVFLTDGNPRHKGRNRQELRDLVYEQTDYYYDHVNDSIIIPIAVGNNVNTNFLKKVSKDGTIFKTGNYNDLYKIIRKLTEVSCSDIVVSQIFYF